MSICFVCIYFYTLFIIYIGINKSKDSLAVYNLKVPELSV